MSSILPGNQDSAALALDGGMCGLFERRKAIVGIGDTTSKKLTALLHMDGNWEDSRGHTVGHSNTYNYQWVEGKYGQAIYKPSNGGVNLSINGVFGSVFPAQYTIMYWGKDGGCAVQACCKSNQNRPDGNGGLLVTWATQPTVWKNGEYGNRTVVGNTSLSGRISGWHHYAFTYNNGVLKWYFDGEKYAEYTIDPSTDTRVQGQSLHIGYITTVDEFAFSDKLLISGDSYAVPTTPYK